MKIDAVLNASKGGGASSSFCHIFVTFLLVLLSLLSFVIALGDNNEEYFIFRTPMFLKYVLKQVTNDMFCSESVTSWVAH